jgi:hypothetical protein
MPDLLKAKIAREIYLVLEDLGADDHLLSIIGSWGDTLDDEEILALPPTRTTRTTTIPDPLIDERISRHRVPGAGRCSDGAEPVVAGGLD